MISPTKLVPGTRLPLKNKLPRGRILELNSHFGFSFIQGFPGLHNDWDVMPKNRSQKIALELTTEKGFLTNDLVYLTNEAY
jgi:hypothetical protein